MNAVTDNLEPLQPISDALLILVFAGLLAISWLNWLPAGVVLAAVILPFGIRRNPKSQRYANWASVYAGTSAFLMPPFLAYNNLLERLSWMTLAIILAHLIGLAFEGVIEKTRLAWLAGLGILVLNPSALGVVGLLGLSILGALNARASRIRVGLQHQTRAGLVVLAVVGFTLAAFTGLLAKPSDLQIEDTVISIPKIASQNQAKPIDLSEARANKIVVPKKIVRPPLTEPAQNVLVLVNLALLIIVSALLVVLVRNKIAGVRHTRKSTWAELIPVVGAFIIALALFAWSSTATQNNGQNSFKPQSAAETGGKSRVAKDEPAIISQATADHSSPIITLVMLLVVLAAAYWAYRFTREQIDSEIDSEPKPQLDSGFEARIQASNRVRAAYRNFLTHAQTIGITRPNAQTTLEFAEHVSSLIPDAAVDVLALTNIYEPVRYGQFANETGALEAEQIVERFQKRFVSGEKT